MADTGNRRIVTIPHALPTFTPTQTASPTSSATPIPSITPTPSTTPTQSVTPSPTPTRTGTPTISPTPTATPGGDLTLTGLVYDASVGRERTLAGAIVAVTLRAAQLLGNAGPDGRYSLFLPASYLNACSVVTLEATAEGYRSFQRPVTVADLRANPGRDFGLWPPGAITVNTTDDELNADGDCALREAIQAANTDAAVDACPPGDGPDVIMLPEGSYALALAGAGEDANATGDLDILDDLKLIGAGIKVTLIDGKGLDRIFHVHEGVTALINGVMLTGGRPPDGNDSDSGGGNADPGGGIANFGDLMLTKCRVTGIARETAGTWMGTGGSAGQTAATAERRRHLQRRRAATGGHLGRGQPTGSGGTGGDPAGIGLAGTGGGIHNAGKLTLAMPR